MKKMMILAALMMTVGTNAYAQRRGGGGGGGGSFYLGAGVMYDDSKETTEAGGVETENKVTKTQLDADLGYIFSGGLYFGAAYISSSSDDGTNKPKSSATGVSLGYFSGGFIGRLSYYMNGQSESGTVKRTEGTGMGAELGYLFPISSSFGLGGSIAYRDIKYKKVENAGVETPNTSFQSSTLSPRLLFAFVF